MIFIIQGRSASSARGENKSPIYNWHKENGAVFGEKAAWGES